MCRYAFTGPYKRHFACFRCRKGFKRPPVADRVASDSDPAPCPECGQRMTEMGLDFKTPPHDDAEQWAVIEHVRRLGYGHMDCGCGGSGPLPIRWGQVPSFLAGRQPSSDGERLAARFAASSDSGHG